MVEPLVSVVIPTYNRPDELVELVNSLLHVNQYKKIEIIIVDDASPIVNYKVLLQNHEENGANIKIIRNSVELWLAGSRNVGVQSSNGEFILLIDDDNIVDKTTIKELVKIMLFNARVGVAAPITYYYPDENRILDAGAKRSLLTGFIFSFLPNKKGTLKPSEPFEVGEVANAFMVKRSVFRDVGLFDYINFPIDNDEADFCFRVRKSGLKVMIVPSAKIWHRHSKISLISGLEFRSEKRAYYVGRNRILICKKHSKNWEYFFFVLLYIPVFCFVYTIPYFLIPLFKGGYKRRFRIVQNFIKGVSNGLAFDGAKLKRMQVCNSL